MSNHCPLLHYGLGRFTMKLVLSVAAFCCCIPVRGQDTSDQPKYDPVETRFKLTPSYYQSSDGTDATDINLRGRRGPHTGWLGFYRDSTGYRQARTGYEFAQDISAGHIVYSAQAASGGFLGGSINAQLGDPIYAIVGFGRTNLKNYYNLNFDPNDAITLGVGAAVNAKTDLSLFHIWDDRLGTRQRVTHLMLHHSLSQAARISVDASYKSGLNPDNEFVKGYAMTVTYAYESYFIRLARDQHANFGNTSQTRLSVGLNF
jgi:hypothetical protein